MRIAVGSDHAGFALKSLLADHLTAAGHEVIDHGTSTADVSVDYPLYGHAVAESVASGQAERGLCVCGTGIGIGIAANKVRGIRAAVVHDSTTALLARSHNDANVLCLGERTTGSAEAVDAVDTFFSTVFAEGRHQRRIDQIAAYDAGIGVPDPANASDDMAPRASPETERHQPTP